MPKAIHYLSADFDIDTKEMQDEERTFSGYASVFGAIDQGRDQVEKGAFKESLKAWKKKGKLPSLLWQHDSWKPIGVWTSMKEDDKGLFVKGRLTRGVQQSDETYALMKDGAISGLSIGYRTIKADDESTAGIRKLVELSLVETSIVTFPMLQEAQVDLVKAAGDIKTIRDLEDALHEVLGFTRAQAKSISSCGWKKSNPKEPIISSEAQALETLIASLSK